MSIQRGKIYFVNLNPVHGREQSGMRPVLVLSIDTIINSLHLKYFQNLRTGGQKPGFFRKSFAVFHRLSKKPGFLDGGASRTDFVNTNCEKSCYNKIIGRSETEGCLDCVGWCVAMRLSIFIQGFSLSDTPYNFLSLIGIVLRRTRQCRFPTGELSELSLIVRVS